MYFTMSVIATNPGVNMSFDNIADVGKKAEKRRTSYNIDVKILDKFEKITKAHNVKKSAVVEGLLLAYIEKMESLV